MRFAARGRGARYLAPIPQPQSSRCALRTGEIVASGMISVVRPGPAHGCSGLARLLREPYPAGGAAGADAHTCINLRLPSHGGLYAWEFEKTSRELSVRVDGQLTFGASQLMLAAARGGSGLTYLTEQQVRDDLDRGTLVRVLADWCPPFPACHLS